MSTIFFAPSPTGKGNKIYALWGKDLELHLTPVGSLRVNLMWSDLDHPSGTEHGELGGGQAQFTRIDFDVVFSQTRCGPTTGGGIAAVR